MKRYVILIAYATVGLVGGRRPRCARRTSTPTTPSSTYVDEHGAHLGSAAPGRRRHGDDAAPGADGARVVTDGPFAELAEQIGGYYDVDLPDLDAAIAAAPAAAAAYTVEIRPVVRIEGYDPRDARRGPRGGRCARSGGAWSPSSSRSSVGSTSSRTRSRMPSRRPRGPGRATASRTGPPPGC